MIGIVLLTIALVLYFKPRYRYMSYFLYISFMLGYNGGFGLWTDSVLGVKNGDLAIIYTLVILVYEWLHKGLKMPKVSFMKWYYAFLAFFLASICFSLIHYDFSLYQIIQGGRSYFLVFSWLILIKIKPHDLLKIFPLLLWITVITSVLYVLQIVVGRPLMPYSGEGSIDSATGLIRLYNAPPLIVFFLVLTFLIPQIFGKRVLFFRIIFFSALMCTLGRTGIFTGLLTVAVALMIQGKASRLVKAAVVLGILFLPFMDMINDRFEEGGTSDDFTALKSGNYQNYESGEDGGTMTYRLAWVYERFDYLKDRPLGEQIFGLGLISDSQPVVYRMYRFFLGLTNEEFGLPTQLATPDIAYGNLLTRLGLGGGILYLVMVISLFLLVFKHRKGNVLFTFCVSDMAMMFLVSFAGSNLSEPKNFAIIFLILSTLFHKPEAIEALKHSKYYPLLTNK